jgi:hypothetical protein
MTQSSSRGGSALTDGCRWVANLKKMDDNTAKKFNLAAPHNYVVMDITKSNYTAKLPAPLYFRRGAGGALTFVDLVAGRAHNIGERLLALLTAEERHGRHFSRRDLLYGKGVKGLVDGIKEAVPDLIRVRDINTAVDHLLAAGWLEEVNIRQAGPGATKTILRVIRPPD